ncbi:MAG: phosphoribosyltransferase family protein [Candidatus Micrarchaeota archaeon]|nr:phosphoribosyltransferase family protein [Candidatus Micrarchaeota archaeon]
MGLKYKKLSFDDVYALCLELSEKLIDYYGKDLEKVVFVAISRGGLIPARILADIVGKRDIWTISAKSYVDVNKKEELVITQDIKMNLENKKILIIDDIADTGFTIKTIKELCELRNASEVKTCTLHYKNKSVTKPDFFADKVSDDVWIVYPWEIHEFNNSKKHG